MTEPKQSTTNDIVEKERIRQERIAQRKQALESLRDDIVTGLGKDGVTEADVDRIIGDRKSDE